ncbi:MAG: hypothetical protein B6242_11445 [Anaerolineaceae bacterium 4572_78]|nr:MAG: hypothetical protein B6242_11445 [Anaerolineaceae bacterium 4572_78]
MDKQYYFDTNALIKYFKIKPEEGLTNIARLVSKTTKPILISDWTVLEIVGFICKRYRQGKTKKRKARKVIERLRSTTIPHFRYFRISPDTIKLSESMVVKYGFHHELTIKDADGSLINICGKENIDVYDPEKE